MRRYQAFGGAAPNRGIRDFLPFMSGQRARYNEAASAAAHNNSQVHQRELLMNGLGIGQGDAGNIPRMMVDKVQDAGDAITNNPFKTAAALGVGGASAIGMLNAHAQLQSEGLEINPVNVAARSTQNLLGVVSQQIDQLTRDPPIGRQPH